MKIKYLGTAAYEGIPSLFCRCETCEKSRREGGRNLRSRSQALVDDELLIDFPADTVWHFHRFGMDWERISDCLITHSHCDHLYTEDIEMAREGYAQNCPRTLHFHAAADGYRKIRAVTDLKGMAGRADVVEVKPYEEFRAGEYRVLPLKASHDPLSSPVLYRVEKDGKSFLYAHDTGWFFEEAWEKLKEAGRLNLVSLDCTGGLKKGWRDSHLCLETAVEVFERMEKEKIIDGNTVRIINHFSHNGNAAYEELVAAAHPYGIVVSYDGLEIKF